MLYITQKVVTRSSINIYFHISGLLLILVLAYSFSLKKLVWVFSPCEDFSDFASSFTDNNGVPIIPPAYF